MTEVEMRSIKSTVSAMCRAPEFSRVRRLVQADVNTGKSPAATIEAILSELGRTLSYCAVADTNVVTSYVR